MTDENKVTKEQIDYINSLPKRELFVGQNKQLFAYDESIQVVYFLDDNGKPTGQARNLNMSLDDFLKRSNQPPKATRSQQSGSPASSKSKEHIQSESKKRKLGKRLRRIADESTVDPSDDIDPDEQKKPGRSKKKSLAAVGCLVLLAAIVFGILRLAGPAAPTSEPEASLSSIEVIQVTEDLIPGDVITESNIQKVTISAETYNQISLTSVSIYQWSRMDSLLGSYAVTYIPQGQYLTYDNVNAVYQQSGNPWAKETSGSAFITVPLPEEIISAQSITFGSIIDLAITKETVTKVGKTETENEEEPVEIEGLEHKTSVQQSSQVDTYVLSGVIVCDLLNTEKNSLYGTFTAWIGIPSGEQHAYIKRKLSENASLAASLVPHYIKIQVTNEQAEALGSLTDDDTTVEITVTDKTDSSSDAKSLYTAAAKALAETITNIQKEIDAEAEEASDNE